MPVIEFLQSPIFLRDPRDQAFTLTAGWSCFFLEGGRRGLKGWIITVLRENGAL